MAAIIRQRRDTTVNWTTNNPILLDGQIGYDTDLKIGKMGNGVDTWSMLPIYSKGDVYDKDAIDTLMVDTITSQGNTFNGNSQLVQTTPDGKFPALDGSNITDLYIGEIGSLTKSFIADEVASIDLANPTVSPIVAVTKEVPDLNKTDNTWSVDSADFDFKDYSYNTTLTPSDTSGSIKLTLSNGSFSSDDIGRTININGGKAKLKDTEGNALVAIELDSTDEALSGEWSMVAETIEHNKLSILANNVPQLGSYGLVSTSYDYDTSVYENASIGNYNSSSFCEDSDYLYFALMLTRISDDANCFVINKMNKDTKKISHVYTYSSANPTDDIYSIKTLDIYNDVLTVTFGGNGTLDGYWFTKINTDGTVHTAITAIFTNTGLTSQIGCSIVLSNGEIITMAYNSSETYCIHTSKIHTDGTITANINISSWAVGSIIPSSGTEYFETAILNDTEAYFITCNGSNAMLHKYNPTTMVYDSNYSMSGATRIGGLFIETNLSEPRVWAISGYATNNTRVWNFDKDLEYKGTYSINLGQDRWDVIETNNGAVVISDYNNNGSYAGLVSVGLNQIVIRHINEGSYFGSGSDSSNRKYWLDGYFMYFSNNYVNLSTTHTLLPHKTYQVSVGYSIYAFEYLHNSWFTVVLNTYGLDHDSPSNDKFYISKSNGELTSIIKDATIDVGSTGYSFSYCWITEYGNNIIVWMQSDNRIYYVELDQDLNVVTPITQPSSPIYMYSPDKETDGIIKLDDDRVLIAGYTNVSGVDFTCVYNITTDEKEAYETHETIRCNLYLKDDVIYRTGDWEFGNVTVYALRKMDAYTLETISITPVDAGLNSSHRIVDTFIKGEDEYILLQVSTNNPVIVNTVDGSATTLPVNASDSKFTIYDEATRTVFTKNDSSAYLSLYNVDTSKVDSYQLSYLFKRPMTTGQNPMAFKRSDTGEIFYVNDLSYPYINRLPIALADLYSEPQIPEGYDYNGMYMDYIDNGDDTYTMVYRRRVGSYYHLYKCLVDDEFKALETPVDISPTDWGLSSTSSDHAKEISLLKCGSYYIVALNDCVNGGSGNDIYLHNYDSSFNYIGKHEMRSGYEPGIPIPLFDIDGINFVACYVASNSSTNVYFNKITASTLTPVDTDSDSIASNGSNYIQTTNGDILYINSNGYLVKYDPTTATISTIESDTTKVSGGSNSNLLGQFDNGNIFILRSSVDFLNIFDSSYNHLEKRYISMRIYGDTFYSGMRVSGVYNNNVVIFDNYAGARVFDSDFNLKCIYATREFEYTQEYRYTKPLFKADTNEMVLLSRYGLIERFSLDYQEIQTMPTYPATYSTFITNSYGEIDSRFWTEIKGMLVEAFNPSNTELYLSFSTDDKTTFKVVKSGEGVRSILRNNAGAWEHNSNTAYLSTTWTDSGESDIYGAMNVALGITANRMSITQLEAVTDIDFITLEDSLNLSVSLKGSNVAPTYNGTTINYDGNIRNEGAVLGTDYEYDQPATDIIRVKSLADNNFKIRII
jgi:hypothetical protein